MAPSAIARPARSWGWAIKASPPWAWAARRSAWGSPAKQGEVPLGAEHQEVVHVGRGGVVHLLAHQDEDPRAPALVLAGGTLWSVTTTKSSPAPAAASATSVGARAVGIVGVDVDAAGALDECHVRPSDGPPARGR